LTYYLKTRLRTLLWFPTKIWGKSAQGSWVTIIKTNKQIEFTTLYIDIDCRDIWGGGGWQIWHQKATFFILIDTFNPKIYCFLQIKRIKSFKKIYVQAYLISGVTKKFTRGDRKILFQKNIYPWCFLQTTLGFPKNMITNLVKTFGQLWLLAIIFTHERRVLFYRICRDKEIL